MESESKTNPTYLIWEGTNLDTEIEKFKRFLKKKYNLHFDSDKDLHQWSVDRFKMFWEAVWIYFDVISSRQYKNIFVKTGPSFLDNKWFSGALFNYAENILRIKDHTVALVYADEEGNSESITFADLFNEVELYAAAFRKNGLQKGDRVACHMSNRKEAVFAMLATQSIGAVWGAAIPYFGARAAANIISQMDPKFLIAVDRYPDNGKDCDILSNLPTIVNSCHTLEKVIIVATKEETYSENISNIKNSCFLQNFLNTAKSETGVVPAIIFEQVPTSHPLFLSFTSGTTGISKGTVHSNAVLLPTLTNVALIYNLKRDDTLMCCFPMGWSPLLNFIPCLSIGVKLFLYNGNPYYVKDSHNFWDVIAQSEATFLFHVSSVLDNWEKNGITPNPALQLEHLKVMGIGSSPVKRQNVEYIRRHITKNTFIGNLYAATESIGALSGFYLNLPSYAGEIQLPALGIDLRCFNSKGDSVVGEIGTIVIATPTPSLPLCLWKDIDNSILNLTYFSQYPGVWCQSDLCWVNPESKGIVIKGRSDDTFIQDGDRFGSADIYFAIHNIEEIEDYICVAQNRLDGDQRVVLFIKMKNGYQFDPDFKNKIECKIEQELFMDCVPKLILEVKDIPYNMNNKRMESTVRKILETNEIPHAVNIKNPECLKNFCDIPEIRNYYNVDFK